MSQKCKKLNQAGHSSVSCETCRMYLHSHMRIDEYSDPYVPPPEAPGSTLVSIFLLVALFFGMMYMLISHS